MPPEFFHYDYIGAPWHHHPCTQTGKCADVGNGGLTLRRVKAMREISLRWQENPTDAPEDVVYSANAINQAPVAVAQKFSAEGYFSVDTVGMHKVWANFAYEQAEAIMVQPFLGEAPCG